MECNPSDTIPFFRGKEIRDNLISMKHDRSPATTTLLPHITIFLNSILETEDRHVPREHSPPSKERAQILYRQL